MSFFVTINDKVVPITSESETILIKGAPVPLIPMAMDFIPFKNWVAQMNKDTRWKIESIHFQSADAFGPKIGFLKWKSPGTFNDKPVPDIVFSRGNSVAVLPILRCNGMRWVVNVIQPRMPGADIMGEIPAGMMDGKGCFVGTAAKEVAEETGIEIKETDLIPLGQGKLFCPSIGGCDERIKLFVFIKDVEQKYLDDLNGRLTGNIEENETITVKLIDYATLHDNTDDMKTTTAMLLLEKSDIRF
jgi:ADP-sugar diphosphatase